MLNSGEIGAPCGVPFRSRRARFVRRRPPRPSSSSTAISSHALTQPSSRPSLTRRPARPGRRARASPRREPPGPGRGSGRVGRASRRRARRRGFHRPPAQPRRGRARPTTRCGPRPRHEHLAELRRLYGFRSFSGGAARELVERLRDEAEQAQSNEGLVRRFVEACRDTQTILPATTTIERLCADALVDAERRIEARIAERVPPALSARPRASARRDGRRRRDAVRLAQAVRAGQQFRRRQPVAGPPRARPAPGCSGRSLPPPSVTQLRRYRRHASRR